MKTQYRVLNNVNIVGRSTNTYYLVDRYAEECPLCHHHITTEPIHGTMLEGESGPMELSFRCNNCKCNHLFVARYTLSNFQQNNNQYEYHFKESIPRSLTHKTWGANVEEVSPNFLAIYDQANSAEQQGLNHICGMGYRKALEFLIKDYLIAKNAKESDEIRGTFLGVCIKKHIEDPRLQAAATAAAWLGNDETHYERKWADKDLNDLKALIDLTVHWIAMEKLSERFRAEMTPEINVTSSLAAQATVQN